MVSWIVFCIFWVSRFSDLAFFCVCVCVCECVLSFLHVSWNLFGDADYFHAFLVFNLLITDQRREIGFRYIPLFTDQRR